MKRWYQAGCVGIWVGCIGFLVIESEAPSYLSTRSEPCANCHVMKSAYNSWSLSSHRENAQCADCHIPHQTIVAKYAAKARDGVRHAYAFTFGTYPQVIRTTENARSIVEANCRRCHQGMDEASHSPSRAALDQRPCSECHRQVPHGSGHSIATFLGNSQSGPRAAPFLREAAKTDP